MATTTSSRNSSSRNATRTGASIGNDEEISRLENSVLSSGAVDDDSIVTITCNSCKVTVQESENTKRTICPHCGNFLSEELERQIKMASTAATRGHRATQALRPSAHGSRLKSSNQSSAANSRPPTASRSNSRQALSNQTSLPLIENRTTPQPPRIKTPMKGSNSHHQLNGANNENKIHSTTNENNNASNGPFQALKKFFGKLGPNNGDNNSKGSKGNKKNALPPGRLPPLSKSTSSAAGLNNVGKSLPIPIAEKKLTMEQLQEMYDTCDATSDWDKITEFFQLTFSSVVEINAIFKDFEREKDSRYTVSDACVKQNLLGNAYRLLEVCPKETQSACFRSTIDLLVDNNKAFNSQSLAGGGRDEVRALLIVLQNPLFKDPAHSIVFAHLLRQISSITQFQHCLVVWLRHIENNSFVQIVHTINAFITRRLFGDSTLPSHVLPPADKCQWWIPSAVKVLAIFNAANNFTSPESSSSKKTGVVPFNEFYNASLELLDLGTQYKTWLNSSGEKSRFSFCQYPFILTLAAKRGILEADSEHQMVLNAQRSLIMDVVGGERVGLETFFLNLHIRRSFLLDDSIDELSHRSSDLKKKLRVNFVGEPGLDVGGLTKEWFLLLVEKIFSPDYGMFKHNKRSGLYWFSSAMLENYQEFHLVGVLMGLAVYNGIILDIRFPPVLYRKLLSPAVCPFDNPNATVGVCQTGLTDLEQIFPDIAKGLREMLNYEGSVEEDFGLTFQVSIDEFGAVKTSELKRGGKTIPVTNENREEYVGLYIDWLLNRSVYRQFRAFYFGFHSVCASNAILLFRPEEIESLVCGSPVVDVDKLRRCTEYENGFSRESETVSNLPISIHSFKFSFFPRCNIFGRL